jgi:hypothetical protein
MNSPKYKDNQIITIETGFEKRRQIKKARIVWESNNKGGLKMSFFEIDSKYRMYTLNPIIIED